MRVERDAIEEIGILMELSSYTTFIEDRNKSREFVPFRFFTRLLPKLEYPNYNLMNTGRES